MIIRKGDRSTFLGPAFRAADGADVLRLGELTGATVHPLPDPLGGIGVELVDPSGLTVKVVADLDVLPPLPHQSPQAWNVGDQLTRVNGTQRAPREPARVQRLGHVVLQTTKYVETLDWYLDTLGLIVSDFLYFPGQRRRGPTMSGPRCWS